MKKLMMSAFSLGCAFTLVAACGADDEIRNTIDCAQICAKFNECVTDIDVTECTDRCEDRADASADVARRAELCEECIEDTTCEEAETCWSNCPVVPAAD